MSENIEIAKILPDADKKIEPVCIKSSNYNDYTNFCQYRSTTRNSDEIVIQPNPSLGYDASISNSFGYSNNENINLGADPNIYITDDKDVSTGFYPFRGLFKFDIDSLNIKDSSQIFSVYFKIYYYYSMKLNQEQDGIGYPLNIKAYPITRAWSEGTGDLDSNIYDGVSWNCYNGINNWNNSGGDYSTSYSASGQTPYSYGWMSINITPMVGAWVDGVIPNYGLILIGNSDIDYLKKFYSSDHSNSGLRPKLEVVYQINQPPIIKNNVSFCLMTEDEDVDIFLDAKYYPKYGIFLDPDENDQLSFFLFNNKSWVPILTNMEYELTNFKIACIQEGRITIIPHKDYYGINYLSFMAVDTLGEFIYHDLIIDIQAVNDRPILNSALNWMINSNNETDGQIQIYNYGYNLTVYQGSEVDLTVTASDVDSSTLYFEIHEYDLSGINMEEFDFKKLIDLDPQSGRLIFKPTNDCVGTFRLNITVDDRYLEDGDIFTFEVLNINDDPVLVKVNDVLIKNHKANIKHDAAIQDQKFVISVEANDPDISAGIFNQLWFFTTSDDEDTLVIDEGWRSKWIHDFSIVPDNNDAMKGYVLINITVQDQFANGPDDWVEINISIENVNDPPVITRVNNEAIFDKTLVYLGQISTGKNVEKLNFTVEAKDIDMDELSLELDGEFEFSLIANNTWNVTYYPEISDGQILMVDVTIHDRSSYNSLCTVTLRWNIMYIQYPPIIEIFTPPGKYFAGDIIEITGRWHDENDDRIYMLLSKTFPDGTVTNMTMIDTLDRVSSYSNTDTFESIQIKNNGTWIYRFNTSDYEKIYNRYSEKSVNLKWNLGGKLNKGNLTFKFKAVEYSYAGLESAEAELSVQYAGKKSDQSSSLIIERNLVLMLIIMLFLIISMLLTSYHIHRRAPSKLSSRTAKPNIQPQPTKPDYHQGMASNLNFPTGQQVPLQMPGRITQQRQRQTQPQKQSQYPGHVMTGSVICINCTSKYSNELDFCPYCSNNSKQMVDGSTAAKQTWRGVGNFYPRVVEVRPYYQISDTIANTNTDSNDNF